jgi:sugar lactone lactonase YvrE
MRARNKFHLLHGARKLCRVIRVPEVAGNFNWGDPDRKTLYICATSPVYSCRMLIPGPAGA